MGRITCLIKPHLAPFEVILKEEDLITVQTKIAQLLQPTSTLTDPW